jgi:hypothetical protein
MERVSMKTQQTVFISAILVAFSGAAWAQVAESTANDAARPAAPEWSESDSNRDGYLTKEELIPFPAVLKHFEKIDSDGDGRISEAEYGDWRSR